MSQNALNIISHNQWFLSYESLCVHVWSKSWKRSKNLSILNDSEENDFPCTPY